MKIVFTSLSPAPAGHYVQAREAGGWLYVSGQLPVRPGTGDLNNATIEDEARQTLENLRHIVDAAGAPLTSVVKVNIYITNIADWPVVNRIYAQFFGEHRPARSVISTGPLHFGSRIEIDAVAYLGGDAR